MKHKTLLNNFGSKSSLVMKFGQFMQYYKIIFCEKILPKMWPGNYFQAFSNLQKILCKKDSVKVSKLIWTNFDRFAIISSLLQKLHLPIEVMRHSLQIQKGLELVFRPQFLYNFLMKFFLF